MISALQQILNKRLETIDRWRKVDVYAWDSPDMPQGVNADPGTFVIYWSEPKRKNIHPYEFKEIPFDELVDVLARNIQRLKNQTKAYK